jgi:Holliday junction resolvase
MSGMAYRHPSYQSARKQLISFLRTEGYQVHPDEVYCPAFAHCWVDVAALKGQDYWAFEYKSCNDSIRRGLEQCRSYSQAFNYVVLVADRHRATASPYFGNFKRNGFGVWSHCENRFNLLLQPQRRTVARRSRVVIERQFNRLVGRMQSKANRRISDWFPEIPGPPANEEQAIGSPLIRCSI